jgi:hypothetical protein
MLSKDSQILFKAPADVNDTSNIYSRANWFSRILLNLADILLNIGAAEVFIKTLRLQFILINLKNEVGLF